MKQKSKLLDLKSDWVFKRIFTKDGNEDILADLLSAILETEIKEIQIKNTELTKNREEQKKSVLDVRALVDNNSIINLEMQFQNKFNTEDRSLQYATKLYAEQLEEGDEYTKTKNVVVIFVLNYELCKRNTYHSIVHFKFENYPKEKYLKLYEEEQQTLTDKLEIHYIELPKFLRLKEVEEDSKLVQWLQLISGKEELIEMALSKKAQAIEKAYKQLKYLSQDEEARQEFDEYQRALLDEKMMKAYAREQGHKERI